MGEHSLDGRHALFRQSLASAACLQLVDYLRGVEGGLDQLRDYLRIEAGLDPDPIADSQETTDDAISTRDQAGDVDPLRAWVDSRNFNFPDVIYTKLRSAGINLDNMESKSSEDFAAAEIPVGAIKTIMHEINRSARLQLEQLAVAGTAAEKALLADVTEKNPDASCIERLRLFKVRRRRWALVARVASSTGCIVSAARCLFRAHLLAAAALDPDLAAHICTRAAHSPPRSSAPRKRPVLPHLHRDRSACNCAAGTRITHTHKPPPAAELFKTGLTLAHICAAIGVPYTAQCTPRDAHATCSVQRRARHMPYSMRGAPHSAPRMFSTDRTDDHAPMTRPVPRTVTCRAAACCAGWRAACRAGWRARIGAPPPNCTSCAAVGGPCAVARTTNVG